MDSITMIPIGNDCAIDTQRLRLWLHLVKILRFTDNMQMDEAPEIQNGLWFHDDPFEKLQKQTQPCSTKTVHV